jgi:hypothetical protein
MRVLNNSTRKVPLRWLSKSQRESLRASIVQAIEAMEAAWKVRPDSVPVRVEYSSDRQGFGGNQYSVLLDSKVMLSIKLEADALRYLLSLPAGVSIDAYGDDGFMAHLEEDFVTELSRQLLKNMTYTELSVRRATPSDLVYQVTQKSLHIFNLASDSSHLVGQIEFLPEAIDKMFTRAGVKRDKELSARNKAIGKEQIQLSATIGQVELPFVELRQIVVGDVLVLNESLSSPVKLNTSTGRNVAQAMLGRNENRIALKIDSLAMSDVIAKRSIQ